MQKEHTISNNGFSLCIKVIETVKNDVYINVA